MGCEDGGEAARGVWSPRSLYHRLRLRTNPLTRILERIKQMTQPGRLKFWQGLTVALMVLGYAGYYLCRSNLAVMLLSIAEELTARGLAPSVAVAKERLGWAVSLGTVGYAVGKFAAGSLVDLLGGRRNYLIGMAGAVACTILFALGGSIPVFTLVWFANRLIQSLGWPGMIKITSRWFSYSQLWHGHGRDQPELLVWRCACACLHGTG